MGVLVQQQEWWQHNTTTTMGDKKLKVKEVKVKRIQLNKFKDYLDILYKEERSKQEIFILSGKNKMF